MKAVFFVGLALVSFLVNCMDNYNPDDDRFVTAAARGDRVLVKMYVAQDVNINARDYQDCTALMRAALWGYYNIVRTLINAGADLELKNPRGQTALAIALNWYKRETAYMLIAVGSEVDTSIDDPQYVSKKYPYFLEYKRLITLLFTSVKTPFSVSNSTTQHKQHELEQLRMLNGLIKNGIPFAVGDTQGNTILHHAVLNNNRVMIGLILYCMCKYKQPKLIKYKNRAGQTPVDLAVLKSPLWLLPALNKAMHLTEQKEVL